MASKEHGYIKYLADLPISVLRENVDFSPSKAIQQIRNSNKRIAIKSKIGKENSLVIFKSKNKTFDFFSWHRKFCISSNSGISNCFILFL